MIAVEFCSFQLFEAVVHVMIRGACLTTPTDAPTRTRTCSYSAPRSSTDDRRNNHSNNMRGTAPRSNCGQRGWDPCFTHVQRWPSNKSGIGYSSHNDNIPDDIAICARSIFEAFRNAALVLRSRSSPKVVLATYTQQPMPRGGTFSPPGF